MRFVFRIEVEAERTEGKFASRGELEGQLREALEGADPGSLDGEAGGRYDVTSWDIADLRPDGK